MNLFKYALKNLKIYKYRSIVTVSILILVLVASVVGFSIQKAAKNVSEKFKEDIGAEVNIEVDHNKVNKSGYAPKKITAEQYEKISKIDHVKSYNYLTEVMLGSNTLKAVGEDSQKGEDKMGVVVQGDDGKPVQLKTPKLKLIGGGGNAELIEFQKGSRSIKEGEAPKNQNEALISEELAKLNKLKIGDYIKLSDAKGKVTKEFKVTGIYEDKTTEDGGSGVDMPIFNRRNEIITDFSSAMSMDDEGMSEVRAIYELDNPEYFNQFKDEVRGLGISEDYSISIDEVGFEKAIGPINNLNSTVGYFIVIILIIAIGILALLSLLSVRERQYEIGVLRAMGMKKAKVGLNFITESCIILIVALVIGVGIGSVITKPVANSLLEQQIVSIEKTKEKETTNNQKSLFQPDNSGNIEIVDTIDVKIDYILILQIAGIGFGIVILTNLINIIYVMKFQPMEIMRKKN